MPTLLAIDTRFHSANFPKETTQIAPVFGGLGTFCFGHHPPEDCTRVNITDGPYRDQVQVLEAVPGANMGIVGVPIYPNRHYRVSVWVRLSMPWGEGVRTFEQHNMAHLPPSEHHASSFGSGGGSGPTIQMGIGDTHTNTIHNHRVSGGWFTPKAFRPTKSDWTLLVGYLHGHQSFRTVSSGAAYSASSHQPICEFEDMKQCPPHAVSTHTSKGMPQRTLSFRFGVGNVHGTTPTTKHPIGNATEEVVQFFLPRIDEVDGTEATVDELLRGYAYTLLAKPFLRTSAHRRDKPPNTRSPNNKTVHRKLNQLDVALDKLCDIDRRLEQVVTIDNITEKIRVVQIGDVAASPDTVVRRDTNGGIEANTAKLNVVEVDVLVTTSDKRLKTRIQPETLGLQFIRMLKPVRYVRRRPPPEMRVARQPNRARFERRGGLQHTTATSDSKKQPDHATEPCSSTNIRTYRYRQGRFCNRGSLSSSSCHRASMLQTDTMSIWCDTCEEGGQSTTTPLKTPPSKQSPCTTPPTPCPSETPEAFETGLIAQDVQAVLQKLGRSWSGHCISSDGTHGIQYAMLTVPLVQAVQELADKQEEIRSMLSDTIAVVQKALTSTPMADTTFQQETRSVGHTDKTGTEDGGHCLPEEECTSSPV